MGEKFPGTPPSVRPPEDRLDSWKEIAAYLNRDVTTVQRWEKREGMPVHRHLHDRIGSVYAYREELDAWTRSRNLRPAQDNQNNVVSAQVPVASPDSAIATSRMWKFCPAAGSFGNRAGDWRRPLDTEDGILLA